MAELATLARPYANAVFSVARDERTLDGWARMLGVISVAAQQPNLRLLLESPEISDQQKAFRLSEVCGDELNERARKLIEVLARNKRLGLVEEIRNVYETLRAAEEESLDVQVRSAFPLTDTQSAALRQALTAKYAKEVQLSSVVDANLLGGAIIRAGDTAIDGSVRGRLDKLAETMKRT
jgi:F-type H+-transporting ATPase subunit delta